MADKTDKPETAAEEEKKVPTKSLSERLNEIVEINYNDPSEATFAKLQQEVAGLFASMKEPEDAVALYKLLPSELTMPHLVSVLELEKQKVKDAQVSTLVRQSLSTMELEPEEKKKVLLLIHECLLQNGSDDREGHSALLDFLSLFTGSETSWNGVDLDALAARAVLNHFKHAMQPNDPESWQFDTICGLRPVRNLQTSRVKEHRLLQELLYQVFAAGKCSEYMSFYAQNKELMEAQWKLENETLTAKVRTLALCTACSETQLVAYSIVAQALCVGQEEVEMYVIEAMSLGLLNAKIDSMAKTIIVKSVHHPLLEAIHWNSLSEKLLAWYQAVSTLVTTFDDVRVQQVKEDKEHDRIEAAARR
ncbi:Eukaryotic translation initiation factor 3 subunit M [Diplonema papillatum]|nr:Eukaryotic translation initiation factor 3 subunit M [Diplonema papillatum]